MPFRRAFIQLKQPVEAQWNLDWKLASTSHADTYRVVDRDTRRTLLLSITRQPLNESTRGELIRHIQRLSACPTAELVEYGFDSAGKAFVVMTFDSYTALDTDCPDPARTRIRFIECVAKIAVCHEMNIALGNVSLGSFVAGKHGRCELTGVLGGFAVQDFNELPLTVRSCMPALQSDCALVGKQVDIHGLAVMGLRMFGAQFPPSGIEAKHVATYVERVVEGSPRWVLEVLVGIVQHPHKVILRDAGDLLGALADIERRYEHSEMVGDFHQSGGASEIGTKRVSVLEIARRVRQRDMARGGNCLQRLMRGPTCKAAGACLILIVLAKSEVIPLGRLSQLFTASISSIFSTSQETESKKESVTTPGAVSFDNLVSKLTDTSDDGETRELWARLRQQIASDKYPLATGIAQDLFVNKEAGSPNDRRMIARLLNPDLGVAGRVQLLSADDAVTPEIAAKFASVFALDQTGSLEEYRNYLLQCVQKLVPRQAASALVQRSTIALVVALDHRNELASASDALLVQKASHEDLWWLLEVHTRKRSARVPALISLALSRAINAWPRRAFLELMRRSEVNSETPFEELIHSARYGPNVRDIERYSGWMAPQAEPALYSVLVSTQEAQFLSAALDGIQNKPQVDALIVQVMRFLRRQGDPIDTQYASLVGTLGLRDGIAPQTLAQGLSSVRGLPLTGELAGILVQFGDGIIIRATLANLGTSLDPRQLLPLLEHEDPAVRMQTIPLLKDLPLASLRESVQRMYVAEKDPQVRAVYEREVL